MSELKLIVDQAVEEMGGWNDTAIDRWSELSGVDIRAIDENTPFDIDVANRLLATFPQVLEEVMAWPAPVPEEPTPEEVITDLSEMAQPLSEALGVSAEEPLTVEAPVPEVNLEPGVAEEAPAPEAVTEPAAEAEVPASSSIEALIKELESLATGVEPTLKEEAPSEKIPEELPAEASAAETHEETPAPQVPVAEKAEEALAEELPAPEEAPEEVPVEAPTGPAWEIPAPVAEELERATRIMEEMETQEYDLTAIEKRVPGFQAACIIKENRIIAKHSRRDVDWIALSQAVSAANGVFRGSLGINEHQADELVFGLGNLFVLGFLVKGAQIIVIVKSDRLGAARAYVSAAIKGL